MGLGPTPRQGLHLGSQRGQLEGGGPVLVGFLQGWGGDEGLRKGSLGTRASCLPALLVALLLLLLLLFVVVFLLIINHLKLLEVVLEGADGLGLLGAPQGEAVLQRERGGQKGWPEPHEGLATGLLPAPPGQQQPCLPLVPTQSLQGHPTRTQGPPLQQGHPRHRVLVAWRGCISGGMLASCHLATSRHQPQPQPLVASGFPSAPGHTCPPCRTQRPSQGTGHAGRQQEVAEASLSHISPPHLGLRPSGDHGSLGLWVGLPLDRPPCLPLLPPPSHRGLSRS